MTVDKLKSINNLTTNSLAIGQKLKISGSDITGNEEYYIVKSGDTLYSIARKYNMTVDELKKLNNLSNNTLSIGQRLKIDGAPLASNSINYVVKSGDTLYKIAGNNNTTVDEIKKLNNLSSNALSINQVLKIPSNNYDTYIVKSGDTLYSIARKYNMTVDKLKDINNLKSNTLSINQTLKVPR